MSKKKIFLIGLGAMGVEYAKVLKALNVPFLAIGRSEKSVKNFKDKTGVLAVSGGINKDIVKENPEIKQAIIAVSVEELGKVTRKFIDFKISSILIEKPAGLDGNDIKKTAKLAKDNKTKVYVAYNRRFYASVDKAREYIKKDGGVLSFSFEFTELSNTIKSLPMPSSVKEEWFMANSSHVVDLAFFLGGKPKTLRAYTAGAGVIPWYSRGSIFAGAGVSENGALFSYQANWQSGGRWGVEIMTPKRRLILRPLEKLFVQQRGSFDIKEEILEDDLDKTFKPGLYLEVKTFLSGKTENLITIKEQAENMKYYRAIISGK